MIREDVLDQESRARDKAWKFVFITAIVLAIAALPTSQFQDLLKMGVWSVGFVGFVATYTWPFIVDAVAVIVLGLIVAFHFMVMLLLYPHIPHHGYLAIGLVAAVECAICVIPVVWLDGRSEGRRLKGRQGK